MAVPPPLVHGAWAGIRQGHHEGAATAGDAVDVVNIVEAVEIPIVVVGPDGRIAAFNQAAASVLALSTTEIGRVPPYPHWPPDRVEENSRLLQQELQGRSPAGGIEVRVMRKDGVLFDARMYVSPLIDARGKQTGWMTSMTNITEAKRIRDQLSASHERFTTVLEGLDAAVSVLSARGRALRTLRVPLEITAVADEAPAVPPPFPDSLMLAERRPAGPAIRALAVAALGAAVVSLAPQAIAPEERWTERRYIVGGAIGIAGLIAFIAQAPGRSIPDNVSRNRARLEAWRTQVEAARAAATNRRTPALTVRTGEAQGANEGGRP